MVPQRHQNQSLTFQVLQDATLHVGTFRCIEQVKQRRKRHLMHTRIARSGKEHHPIKQRLQTHQRPNPFIKRIFKKNHYCSVPKSDVNRTLTPRKVTPALVQDQYLIFKFLK